MKMGPFGQRCEVFLTYLTEQLGTLGSNREVERNKRSANRIRKQPQCLRLSNFLFLFYKTKRLDRGVKGRKTDMFL